MNTQRKSEAEALGANSSESECWTPNTRLDQLIAEREEEKRKMLKEKLKQKLKTIRDRRIHGLNNEAFPEDAFEKLLRNNIWEIVFEYLADPFDVTTAYFACQTFTEILEERRKLMMLPKVLDVFKTKADEFYRDDYREKGEKWCENRKMICLNARGVSKAWKEIAEFHLFDSAYEKNDWFLKTDGLDEYDDQRSNMIMFRDEKSVDEALSILRTYAQSQEPSCLLRNLQICLDPDIRIDPVMKITELVRIHGTSFWFFQFQWSDSRNFAEAYDNLCELLQNMPNLKGFVLQFEIKAGVAVEVEALRNFQRRLNERQFPGLNSLEHLAFKWESFSSLVSQSLRKCGNLKSVNLSGCETVTEEVSETLMGLSLERYVGCAAMITSNRVAWPLKHLEITRGLKALHASQLFPAINRFQDTLEHLRIWNPVKMLAMNPRLQLKNLKSVHIKPFHRRTMNLDDLLPLKSLEEISVESVEYEDYDAEVKVKRYRKNRDMESSNIWQCFPNLRRFKVKFTFGFITRYRPTSP